MTPPLRFRLGLAGALAPFVLFLSGVIWLALSGAPDERGFWPVLLAALALGLALAKDRTAYSESVIESMGQPIVALMILAWLLSGVLAVLLNEGGLVQSLVWVSRELRLGPGAYVGAAFVICVVVSTATGTSFGTILLAGPLLYPAGRGVGADPAVLMGAILAGATWGDSISPVSDTTIASAGSQLTDVPGTVRSRLKYVVPAGVAALVASVVLALVRSGASAGTDLQAVSPRALPLLLVPAVVVTLMVRQKHLVEGLMAGIGTACVLGLGLGLFPLSRLITIDRAAFGAKGLLVDGLNRGVGVSIFTLLLMGLVGAMRGAGVLDTLTGIVRRRAATAARAEWWIVGLVSLAVLLTTHSVVAMLSVGPVVREVGMGAGVSAYRRANLLDMTVCTWPFVLPYFLPTILAASATTSGVALGMPRLAPLDIGLMNTYAWALAAVVPLSIISGYGRGDGGRAPAVGEP